MVGRVCRMTFMGGGRACMYVVCFVHSLIRAYWDSLQRLQILPARDEYVCPHTLACLRFTILARLVEVVLAVLLQHFKFTPARKDIVWNNADVTYPAVGPDSTTPSLPMVVEALHP